MQEASVKLLLAMTLFNFKENKNIQTYSHEII